MRVTIAKKFLNHYSTDKMKSTTLLILMITFIGFACSSKQTERTHKKSATTAEVIYQVEGMTCEHCEMSIQKGINRLEGIAKVVANHKDSTARVVFDPSITDKKQIAEAIKKRGYKVVE